MPDAWGPLRVPQPLPPGRGPHLLLGRWLSSRQACLWVVPPVLCLSGREMGSLEGGASEAIRVMGSHQVRIKPVAGPWRRIPRPARLFCCWLQHLPSPTHRGPERLPRAPSPRARISSRAPSRRPAALSCSLFLVSASPPPRIHRIPLGSPSAVERYRGKGGFDQI